MSEEVEAMVYYESRMSTIILERQAEFAIVHLRK